MEGSEADQILFLSLRDLGFSDFPADNVSEVSDLRPRDVIAICLYCLHAVRGGGVGNEGSNPIPTSDSSSLPSAPSLSSASSSGLKNKLPLTINDLPSGASERYLLCSTMASEVHALGYPGQVTFQQFLYPDPDQLRQLLRFLVGKAAVAAEHRHRRSRSGRSTVRSLVASFSRRTDADVGLGSGGGGGGGSRGVDAGYGRRRERSVLEEEEAAAEAEAPAAASAGDLADGESEGVNMQGGGGVGAARSSSCDEVDDDWATPQGSPSGMSRHGNGSAAMMRGPAEGEGEEGEVEAQWPLHGSATMLRAWDSQMTFDERVGGEGLPVSADVVGPSSDDGALEGLRRDGLNKGSEVQAHVKGGEEEEEDGEGEGSDGVRGEVESASGHQQLIPAHLEQLQRHIASLRALLDEDGESLGAQAPVGGMRRVTMTKRKKKKTREEHLERVGALERSIARQEEALSQSRSNSLAVQRDYNRALERLERVRLLVDTSIGRAATTGKPAAAAQLPPALHDLRQQFVLLHNARDTLEGESARAERLGMEVAAAEARWRGVAPQLRKDVAAVRQENEALTEVLKEKDEHKK